MSRARGRGVDRGQAAQPGTHLGEARLDVLQVAEPAHPVAGGRPAPPPRPPPPRRAAARRSRFARSRSRAGTPSRPPTSSGRPTVSRARSSGSRPAHQCATAAGAGPPTGARRGAGPARAATASAAASRASSAGSSGTVAVTATSASTADRRRARSSRPPPRSTSRAHAARAASAAGPDHSGGNPGRPGGDPGPPGGDRRRPSGGGPPNTARSQASTAARSEWATSASAALTGRPSRGGRASVSSVAAPSAAVGLECLPEPPRRRDPPGGLDLPRRRQGLWPPERRRVPGSAAARARMPADQRARRPLRLAGRLPESAAGPSQVRRDQREPRLLAHVGWTRPGPAPLRPAAAPGDDRAYRCRCGRTGRPNGGARRGRGAGAAGGGTRRAVPWAAAVVPELCRGDPRRRTRLVVVIHCDKCP